jgi:Protein of unknown function (DUF2933)
MTLKHCYNWKVLAGLATVAVGVFLVAPGTVGRVLPLLLFAACPLSMLVMMAGMGRMQRGHTGGEASNEPAATVESAAGSCCDTAALPRRGPRVADIPTLKGQLAALAIQHEDLAGQIRALEATGTATKQERLHAPAR